MAAGPADKPLDTFRDLVFDPIVEKTILGIIALAPWVSFPPIAFIVKAAVRWIANFLYENMKEAINFEIILLKNVEHQKAFADASIELKKMARSKGIDSPEFRSLRNARKQDFAKLIRYTGT